MADAHESPGKYVQDEAPGELVSLKGQELHAVAVGVVAPAKARSPSKVTRLSLDSATRWV